MNVTNGGWVLVEMKKYFGEVEKKDFDFSFFRKIFCRGSRGINPSYGKDTPPINSGRDRKYVCLKETLCCLYI